MRGLNCHSAPYAMFRNLRCYRVSSPWPDSEEALSEQLSSKAFRPCSAFSERSAGWESPGEQEGGRLCRRIGGADLMELRTQSRILPAAAVKETLTDRVAEYRQRMGESPPRREMQRLKEAAREELLPKALVQSSRVRGFMLPADGLLVVDAGALSRAEWFVEHLRACLPGLRCEPLQYERSPATLIQEMFLGKVPSGFTLGRECRMADPQDGRSTGTWRHVDLEDEAIRRHVRDGMRIVQLAFAFDAVLSGVLGEDGVISRFKLADGALEDGGEMDDALAVQDSEFVLLTGLVRRLLQRMAELLDGFADATPVAQGVKSAS